MNSNDYIYPDVDPSRRPDPLFCALLSGCCFVGLGQMAAGQVSKGLTHLVFSILLIAVTGGLLAPFIWLATIVDAYVIASRLRQGLPVRMWESCTDPAYSPPL
jgi:TM2 domain-containing membrane protein YozV